MKDYSTWLDSQANGRRTVKILLTLHGGMVPNTADFVQVSYDDYFNRVEHILGSYWGGAHHKYL